MEFLESISHEKSNRFSKLILDYLAAHPSLDQYYSCSLSVEAIKKSIENRPSVDRELLTSQILTTYAQLPENKYVNANINLLSLDNTFTVTAAHQPLLLGGPLYFFYKILNAVGVCQFLKNEMPEYHFVPVYYLGSEDDDIAEVGQVNFRNKHYQWNPREEGPVGRLSLNTLQSTIQEIISRINPQLEHGKSLIQILKFAYNKETFSEATISLVHELLGNYGVVILDPDKKEYKRSFIPFFQKEVTESRSHVAVTQSIENLSQNYKIQATSREVNLFYAPGHLRTRIEYANGMYSTPKGQQWTQDELLDEISTQPENFSTNVITRPLYQEFLLPNCVFIGGGGEIAYWLQLKKSFEAYQINFPALLLRNSFQIFTEKQIKSKEKLGLDFSDLFLEANEIHKRIVSTTLAEWNLKSIKEKHLSILSQYEQLDLGMDPTLAESITAHSQRIANMHDRLAERFYRAAKRKHSQQIQSVNKLLEDTLLAQGLQERTDSFIDYYLLNGSSFFDHLISFMNSLTPSFVLLSSRES